MGVLLEQHDGANSVLFYLYVWGTWMATVQACGQVGLLCRLLAATADEEMGILIWLLESTDASMDLARN